MDTIKLGKIAIIAGFIIAGIIIAGILVVLYLL